MAHSASNWLHRISKGWVASLALIIFLLFTALVLPRQAASSELDTGSSGSPDTSFYYSREELYGMAEAYGEAGRQAYVRARFSFDVVWPLVYTFFLVTAISWTTTRGFPALSIWQRANLVPIAAAVFDFLENISTSLVMWRFPAQTAVVDYLAPVFTTVKWILVGGSFLLLLATTSAALWQRRTR